MHISEVILEVFDCYCNICAMKFEAYDFPDFEYGRRLLRAPNGDVLAMVELTSDLVFNQISSEFAKIVNRECIDKIFSITCDPIGGVIPDLSKGIVCPQCGSSKILRNQYQPMKIIKKYIPVVSHYKWNLKSNEEKQIEIHKVIQKYCNK